MVPITHCVHSEKEGTSKLHIYGPFPPLSILKASLAAASRRGGGGSWQHCRWTGGDKGSLQGRRNLDRGGRGLQEREEKKQAVSGCRRKMKGTGSSIYRPSYPGVEAGVTGEPHEPH